MEDKKDIKEDLFPEGFFSKSRPTISFEEAMKDVLAFEFENPEND